VSDGTKRQGKKTSGPAQPTVRYDTQLQRGDAHRLGASLFRPGAPLVAKLSEPVHHICLRCEIFHKSQGTSNYLTAGK
jgi:hypothetical protein